MEGVAPRTVEESPLLYIVACVCIRQQGSAVSLGMAAVVYIIHRESSAILCRP